MAYGLELFNASGKKQINASGRITKFVMSDTRTLTLAAGASVDITCAGIVDNGTYAVLNMLGQRVTITIFSGFYRLTAISALSSAVTKTLVIKY